MLMISVTEAQNIALARTVALPVVTRPLLQAAGMILAEDVYAGVDVPAFPQSSMDGYALLFSGWQSNQKLKISGEIAAGDQPEGLLSPENAVRIFTGAPVPPGADTVIEQESTIVEDGILRINKPDFQAGKNVRPQGSEIKAGQIALNKGAVLSPAALGFLAGIGVSEVPVFPKPRIGIIVTGKELQTPGRPLEYGQVYESNSVALLAALQQMHLTDTSVLRADDRLEHVTGLLQQQLEQSDVVLLTGGISVGEYDFVLKATELCGVEQQFYKVRQRPGKPLYFGMKGNKPVFALPGNPASVLTCFYEYVLPALYKMSGRQRVLQVAKAPLAADFKKTAALTHFLKGYYDGNTVMPLGAQESYRLRSFAGANCLIVIGEAVTECRAGELVDIHLLPAG